MEREMHQLQRGATLHCSAGTVRIIDFIAAGGQGEVYKVELNGRQYALKYYFNDPKICSHKLKENLISIIENPVESKAFVWPLYLVENGAQFGYIMELIPSGYRYITEWIGGRFDTTLDVLVKACLNLCDAFHDLHAMGYSYKDISIANVGFHPDSGEVLIVDNDNVTPNLKAAGVMGTNGFMAPELVSGRERVPNRFTDLHSLAVLLFHMLVGEHPLNGKKEYNMSLATIDEEDILKELYGIDTACFIFKDSRNLDRYIEPREQSHVTAKEFWMMYPDFIREMFTQAFVPGIKEPHERPLSNEWAEAFVKLMGLLYRCPDCGMTHLYDKDRFYQYNGAPACDKCGRRISVPRIKIGEDIVLMTDKSVVCACSFGFRREDKFAPVLGVEVSHGGFRLKNLSNHTVEFHNKHIRKGEWTDYITTSLDQIHIDGKAYYVAL